MGNLVTLNSQQLISYWSIQLPNFMRNWISMDFVLGEEKSLVQLDKLYNSGFFNKKTMQVSVIHFLSLHILDIFMIFFFFFGMMIRMHQTKLLLSYRVFLI